MHIEIALIQELLNLLLLVLTVLSREFDIANRVLHKGVDLLVYRLLVLVVLFFVDLLVVDDFIDLRIVDVVVRILVVDDFNKEGVTLDVRKRFPYRVGRGIHAQHLAGQSLQLALVVLSLTLRRVFGLLGDDLILAQNDQFLDQFPCLNFVLLLDLVQLCVEHIPDFGVHGELRIEVLHLIKLVVLHAVAVFLEDHFLQMLDVLQVSRRHNRNCLVSLFELFAEALNLSFKLQHLDAAYLALHLVLIYLSRYLFNFCLGNAYRFIEL